LRRRSGWYRRRWSGHRRRFRRIDAAHIRLALKDARDCAEIAREKRKTATSKKAKNARADFVSMRSASIGDAARKFRTKDAARGAASKI